MPLRLISRETPQHAHHVGQAVVDEGVHRHHVVEGAELLVQHVARHEMDAARSQLLRHPLARNADQRGRDVDGSHVRAALAASTASAPVPQPASRMRAPRRSVGQEGEQRGPHPVAARAHRGADAAHRRVGRQPLTMWRRRPVEVGFDLFAALEVAVAHQSNPRKSKMSRSFMERASQGSLPAQSWAASRIYSFCT